MKKIIINSLLIFTLIGLISFTVFENENNSLAKTEQVQGIYIFYNSKPVSTYDVIGSEKTSFALKGNPEELINIAIKKAKKDFPNTEGIVFTNEDMDVYNFIVFKKQ